MKSVLFAVLLATVISTTGCAKFFGSLRKDLDDSVAYEPPTYGGRWTERGMLADDGSPGDQYDYLGHMERSPASSALGETARGRGSWVSQDDEDANRRDRYRGSEVEGDEEAMATFSNTPHMAPPVKRLYKNGNRATRADFVDESQNEGSLWASDGQTNYYFTKNKIRGVGDIVTLNIEQDLLKDVYTEFRRSLNPQERETELALAQERINRKFLGQDDPEGTKKDSLASTASAPTRAPATAAKEEETKARPKLKDPDDAPRATYTDIDVSKSVELKAGDTMMGEIIERYPNGNYKIRAVKRIPYAKGAPRMLTLVGIVKGTDIGEDDGVNSGKLYEYRLEAVR